MKYMNFSSANCKNCYKCLRSCPVKAIKFKNQQAEIVEDRCIACSHCLAICPQKARHIVSDLERVKEAINSEKKVIATIAPSFVGFFDVDPGRFVSLLRKLGFSYIEETASGADVVSELYRQYMKEEKLDNYISTACPSANYIVEKYFPNLIKYMIPTVSPMIAHGKVLRKIYGEDSFIVFIGPCMGKKIESEGFTNKEVLDAVITFEEFTSWVEDLNIDIQNLEPCDFDRNSFKDGRKYPLFTGIVNCVSDVIKEKKLEVISISGTEECMELFKSIEKGEVTNAFIEASACKGSCIGGPGMINNEKGYYKRVQKVKNYINKNNSIGERKLDLDMDIEFSRSFIDKSIEKKLASEKEIEKIMMEMGKYSIEDELNCGVCGYNTCREKAEAIFEGMAESSMCLHYMRNRAESIRNVIFENIVNCIIFLDGEMRIKDINPAAENAFTVKAESIVNKPISLIMDDQDFRNVKETGKDILGKKVSFPNYNLDFIETVRYLEKQDIVMIALVNITEEEKNKRKLVKLKENTINTAQEVIEKQMRVAQEIASLLGETTAETKIALTKLKKVVEEEKGCDS
ncbi:[Fe-Fe] hydrogenase large subunit C-terminal domain-containing protein [Clostridium scatologenes]|uniref:Hydrogenase large subunit domain protein n=1 Tax=Clostridium scatologenes TaxID=1548 RepID=A0A0E3M5B8_CLOSL|nr:[Fe-Fe] hydrogenase large subunit C-terminal domain-containing protein [Clostridium scatologenes]AKA67884.1 hydrogenase large subunit domain protein [Clostridium scatologenes]